MLKLMRKNTKLIIWLVIVAFCLWGGYAVSTQFQKQGRVAGQIFGKDITFQEFNLFYRTNQIFSFAGKKPADDPNLLTLQTWQSLIYSYEARNQKINVSDEEVRQEITRLLKDQKIENPSAQFYERWLLSSFGMKPDEFEGQLRELLRIQKLVKQFNEAKIPDPSAADLKTRFQLDNNFLDLDIVDIAKEEDAKLFYDKVKAKTSNWSSLAKKNSYKTQNSGKVSVSSASQIWEVPENVVQELLKQPVGYVHAPFKRSNGFSLVRIKALELADEAKFTPEIKKQYTDQVTGQKKYERFLKWNNELEARANLKDFTPQPRSAKPSSKITDLASKSVTQAKDSVSATVKKS